MSDLTLQECANSLRTLGVALFNATEAARAFGVPARLLGFDRPPYSGKKAAYIRRKARRVCASQMESQDG